MADIKVLTNASRRGGGSVSVAGTRIMVGAEQIERVVNVELLTEGMVWKLRVEVIVDPHTLFEALPEGQ